MIKTELGQRVSKVLFEIDPMDLRQFEVPEDEYDAEGEMIVQRLVAGEKLSVDLVREIFERMFGKDTVDHHLLSHAFEDVVKALNPLLGEILKKPSKLT